MRRPAKRFIIGSVMASMCMIAIEATIVSTAMPQIVAQLGGLRFYSWVFAAFLLAQTAMTVIFGSLSDTYGRKPIMLCGIAIFLLGSTLAGFAWSMPSMIAFRLVQGAGAAAVQTMAMTIVADLYPARERGKIQGYLASVWAVSAVLGPVVGGVIVRHVSWAWVFWINIPVGLIAAAGFTLFLHEHNTRQRHSIDVAGAIAFAATVTSLLVALTEIDVADATIEHWSAGLFVVALAIFVLQERRSATPLVSLSMWARRPVAATNASGLLASMALIGLTAFTPMYVQIVLRRSPVIAGLALTTMLVGWPAGATLAARLFQRFKLHHILLVGSALLPVGAMFFVLLGPDSSPLSPAIGSLIMGFGMGLRTVSSLVLLQEIVERPQRGSVTASNLFSRNLGSTLGATVLGAVLNYGLAGSMGAVPVSSARLRQLLEAAPSALPSDEPLRYALQHALNLTFWAMLALTLITVLVASLVPAAQIKRADPMPQVGAE